MPDLAVSGELADNTEPHPAAEPQLSFPAQIQENTVEIALPHTGRLKIQTAFSFVVLWINRILPIKFVLSGIGLSLKFLLAFQVQKRGFLN